jgi:hypothetical protein
VVGVVSRAGATGHEETADEHGSPCVVQCRQLVGGGDQGLMETA